jgi:hypothetical protein
MILIDVVLVLMILSEILMILNGCCTQNNKELKYSFYYRNTVTPTLGALSCHE